MFRPGAALDRWLPCLGTTAETGSKRRDACPKLVFSPCGWMTASLGLVRYIDDPVPQ